MFDIDLLHFDIIDRDESTDNEYELSQMGRKFVMQKTHNIKRLMQIISIKVYNMLWNQHKLTDEEFEILAYHVSSIIENDLITEQKVMEEFTNYDDTEYLQSLNVLSIDVVSRVINYDIIVNDQSTAFYVNFWRNK